MTFMTSNLRARIVVIAAAFAAFAGSPMAADPAELPGLAPRSAEASLGAVARLRGAHRTEGGCTAVLIADDMALTAGHCARGPVSGPRALQLHFRPDQSPPAFRVTVRHVAFHAENRQGAITTDTAHGDLAFLRLAMPVPPEIATPIPVATAERPEDQPDLVAIYGYRNGQEDLLRGHSACALRTLRGSLLGSNCRVVSGFSGAPVLSGAPGTWRVEGIAVATLNAGDLRAFIADVAPWPPFSGPYAPADPP